MSNQAFERYFTQIDSPKASAFRSAFPVDLSVPEIKKLAQIEIPDNTAPRKKVPGEIAAAIDTALFIRGSKETFATTSKGAVALAPHHAKKRAYKSSDEDGRDFESKQFVVRALTDGKPLTVVHALYNRDNGNVTDFSVMVDAGPTAGRNRHYILRGYLAPDRAESEQEFEIVNSSLGRLELDKDTAHEFVTAVSMQTPYEIKGDSFADKIMGIVDSSPMIRYGQNSEHLTIDQAGNRIVTRIEREQLVARGDNVAAGVGKIAMLAIEIGQVGPEDSDTGVSTDLSYGFKYSTAQRPRYQAHLSAVVHDPNERLTYIERANKYANLSDRLREHPEEFFKAIYDIAANLARLDDQA